MIHKELNASSFEYSLLYYNEEFEKVLSKIIICYQLMKIENVTLPNDENLIRDCLYLNYLNNNHIRNKIELKEYYFDRETLEDRTNGRVDLRVITPYSFEDTDAYYTLECKRLNSANLTGASGLNAKYIKNGISRFSSKKYSAHYNTNGLIGFIIEAMDIEENIKTLNQLIKADSDTKTVSEIKFRRIVPNFDYSYTSLHSVNKVLVILYHLMFDFSDNTQ